MRHTSLSQQPSAQVPTPLAVILMGVPERAPGVETKAISPKAGQQREGESSGEESTAWTKLNTALEQVNSRQRRLQVARARRPGNRLLQGSMVNSPVCPEHGHLRGGTTACTPEVRGETGAWTPAGEGRD